MILDINVSTGHPSIMVNQIWEATPDMNVFVPLLYCIPISFLKLHTIEKGIKIKLGKIKIKSVAHITDIYFI